MPYRYQRIESSIWFDEKFRNLTEGEQRMWLYILSCPHGNLIGLFPLPLGYIDSDLNLPDEEARRRLGVLIDKELCSYDEETSLIFIHNFLEYNPLINPKQIGSAQKILFQLPQSHLLSLFIKRARETKKGLNQLMIEFPVVNLPDQPLLLAEEDELLKNRKEKIQEFITELAKEKKIPPRPSKELARRKLLQEQKKELGIE